MEKIKKLYEKCGELTSDISSHHVGAYAAQTAYSDYFVIIDID